MDVIETNKLEEGAELERPLADAVEKTAETQESVAESSSETALEVAVEPTTVPSGETPEEQTTEKIAEPVVENEKQEISSEVLNESAEVLLTSGSQEEYSPVEGEEEPLVFNNKAEIIAFFKSVSGTHAPDLKEKVDYMKQAFYRIHKAETDAARKTWIEEGNDAESFVTPEDAQEAEFKTLLTEWREKRAEHHAEQEKIRNNNLEKKNRIIEDIRALTESTEDIGRNYPEFRRLQQSWKETGPVPQESLNELWKNYQIQIERFYDLLKINNEFREYDFKKNLELKTTLCESAEKLCSDTDVVTSFRQLQKLHEEWRETGPVAKEFREEIWNRFKAASGIINKNHQTYFEQLKSAETENLEKKTAICETLEAIDFTQIKSYKDWESKTTEVIELQEKWKTVGFAPKKVNVKIFERYRAACDQFFHQKSEFYKAAKDTLNQNLDKKKALCEKAEALKENTEWKATADQLIQIQKEWKTIGPVPKKYSDAIWKRFIAACDYFFEQKEKNAPNQKNEELKNLAAKKELIQKVEELVEIPGGEEAGKLIQDLNAQWNAIGHVPFKEKDKIYKAWRDAMDKAMDRLRIDRNARRLSNFQSNLEDKSQGKVLHERERLLRQFDSLSSEIKTAENNIGFFTTSKSSANSLLDDMKKKIDALKEERDVIYKKIKMIDDQL